MRGKGQYLRYGFDAKAEDRVAALSSVSKAKAERKRTIFERCKG